MKTTDPALRLYAGDRSGHWSDTNITNAVRILERFRASLSVPLLSATKLDAQAYLTDRRVNGRYQGRPISVNTVIVEHRQIVSFFKWAADEDGGGLIERNPMRGLKAPKGVVADPADTPVLTEEEYRALLAAAGARKPKQSQYAGRSMNARRDQAILALMWSTGGRRAEIAGLRLRDIDWDTQMVHFAKTKSRSTTAKSRDCYFDDDALRYLTRYVMERGDHDGPLFESQRRVPGAEYRPGIKADAITLLLRRLAKVTGLSSAALTSAHSFRRAVATAWLESGGSVRDLETNHGWKHDGRMASHYTRAAETAQAASEARRISEARRRGRHLRSA